MTRPNCRVAPMKRKKEELSVDQRWEKGIGHDPRSLSLVKSLANIDHTMNNDVFGFKFGGDGDNGEELMFLLDIYFERQDRTTNATADDEILAAVAATGKDR